MYMFAGDTNLSPREQKDDDDAESGESTGAGEGQFCDGQKIDADEEEEEEEQEEQRQLELLKQSVLEMSFNRIDGGDDLYVGGIWALRRPKALDEKKITHILSVVGFQPDEIKSDGGVRSDATTSTWEHYGKKYKHLMIDIDDVDEEDLLVHLPKAVRFIDEALYPKEEKTDSDSAEDAVPVVEASDANVPEFADLQIKPPASSSSSSSPRGAVYVHCAMGKSRSVSVVVAYLLWKYPQRFRQAADPRTAAPAADELDQLLADEVSSNNSDPDTRKRASRAAVNAAVKWVRKSRQIADPNFGFRAQLQMWWEMGCPDDVEGHPTYRKWAFMREVERSVECGMAPTTLRFEDEEQSRQVDKKQASTEKGEASEVAKVKELKCRKCRRALARDPFIVASNHETFERDPRTGRDKDCQHFFIEALSWMRATLEKGELEGRLVCPNERCGASVGRYSWRGFRCSCGEWVTPAFSLQKARVDEVSVSARGPPAPASIGIRMPPGSNL